MIRSENAPKMRSSDRILVLEKMEDKPTLNSMGITDNRLFSGENRIHAIMDSENCWWSIKYDHGLVPQPLRQSFTNFTKLMNFVTGYFERRNIRIKEVLD